jgi:biotin-dependent carboxylase-like uncharacterized protein
MTDAVLHVERVGPLVSIQDVGRVGYLRYGVPRSGPMDRTSFMAANVAIGNSSDSPAIEVSMGGLSLRCVSGEVTLAIAGGGFVVDHDGRPDGSWSVATIRAGQRLAIRPGHWGTWTYLAFAGALSSDTWLGSASTHALSGFGGGRLETGASVTIIDAKVRSALEGAIPCPVGARPRAVINVVLGPQDRFFDAATIATLFSTRYQLSDAYDRMGVRLRGSALPLNAPLTMPSEAIARGSIQISGDGVPTVLLADHQTTGGYPKIATVVDADLDSFTQLRPRNFVAFRQLTPEMAVELDRRRASVNGRYFAAMRRTKDI